MKKEEVKQWLINDGQVPEGCDDNEYWNHWYDVISRMTEKQGQTLPLDSVRQSAFLLNVLKDNNPHNVQLSYDCLLGRVDMYIDGELVDVD